MTTLLVANRGEIARRIFRTARRMGMRCIAVYSDADVNSLYVAEADEALRIGPAPAPDSYLRIDSILDAAKLAGADFIHPGYGFLAESAEFAEACESEAFTLVGPPSSVLASMGSKDHAKKLAQEAGVPVVGGYAGADQSDAAFERAAEEIGYPVMVKPAEGGGGKGMTVVHTPYQMTDSLASARRISLAAFNDERLLIERFLTGARHVEVQILADTHGNVVHLGERDCSIQRRHQKVVEESPAPSIGSSTRDLLCESAVKLAQHVGYVNAGTCEFVVGDDDTISFLEVNARLQVEHPVTEMVTGVDLVEQQLRVAAGEPLAFSQKDVQFKGHSIEARVYAEDPEDGFLPQAGRLVHVKWPGGVRVDSAVGESTGSLEPDAQEATISTHYDPMIAKLISHGTNRREALGLLRAALNETEVIGVATNVGFLIDVLSNRVVAAGEVTTGWMESAYEGWRRRPDVIPEEVISIAGAAEWMRLTSNLRSSDPWSAMKGWRGMFSPGRSPSTLLFNAEGVDHAVTVSELPGTELSQSAAEVSSLLVGERQVVCSPSERHYWISDHKAVSAFDSETWYLLWEGTHYEVGVGPRQRRLGESPHTHLEAPMPGQVIAVRVASGDRVRKGQDLVVVEAMKMEHVIRAPADGRVEEVLCSVGDQVDAGRTLVDFEREE